MGLNRKKVFFYIPENLDIFQSQEELKKSSAASKLKKFIINYK